MKRKTSKRAKLKPEEKNRPLTISITPEQRQQLALLVENYKREYGLDVAPATVAASAFDVGLRDLNDKLSPV